MVRNRTPSTRLSPAAGCRGERLENGGVTVKTHLSIAAVLLVCAPAVAIADNVVTYHNSNQRDGAYTIPTLTSAAAANMKPDTKFDGTISGNVYAQPLFWKPKGADKGLVIVATEANSVYALDENS